MSQSVTILIVDDDPLVARACRRIIERTRHRAVTAATAEEARERLGEGDIDVCLADVNLPDGDGISLVQDAKRLSPGCEVIVMTSNAGVDTAVAAVKAGAYDFLTKPFEPVAKVRITVEKALEKKALWDRTRRLEREVDGKYGFENIVGSAASMARALGLAKDVAYSESSVLIRGESGTGKELIARAIHRASPRSDKPFVVLNCGALPENLIESELFGHVKGAFTGAVSDKRGLFEQADGGTILLDEIGEMPATAQVRLLRVLQDGEIRRVGKNDARTVNVRVLAATNANLEDAIDNGRFREDLYYRLNVITVELPPLRARRDDIPLLAAHFLKKYATKLNKKLEFLTDDALQQLVTYRWPGNVRELENAIERAAVLAKETSIGTENLPDSLFGARGGDASVSTDPVKTSVPYREAKEQAVRDFEKSYVSALLRAADGNMAEAARIAGLDRSNFRKIVTRAGVDFRDFQNKAQSLAN